MLPDHRIHEIIAEVEAEVAAVTGRGQAEMMRGERCSTCDGVIANPTGQPTECDACQEMFG